MLKGASLRRHASRSRTLPSACSPRLFARRTVKQSSLSRKHTPTVCFASASVYAPVLADQLKNKEEKLLPLPTTTENVADDVTLCNPLARMERLSTGWFGVVLEYEGVIIESTEEAHQQAWLQVASELGYPRPLGQVLRRIKNLPDDVVITRIFNWTRHPITVKQVVERKAQIYEGLLGQRQPAVMLEALPFLETLRRYSVPIALATSLPESKVQESLSRHGLQPHFDAVVTRDDTGAVELEYTLAYAASRIQRPPARVVVVGDSNNSVEAARELGMKCVVVTGNQPVYQFVEADLVVRHLGQLSFMNMKKLFGNEELVQARREEQLGDESISD